MTDSLTTVWFSDYDFGVSMEDVDLELWHTAQKIDEMVTEGNVGSRLNAERRKLARLEAQLGRLLGSLDVGEGSLIQLDGQIVLVLKEGWLCNGVVYTEALDLFAFCESVPYEAA